MRSLMLVSVCMSLFALSAFGEDRSNARDTFWPQWRGPQATGVSPHGNPPTEWSETKNIRWKVDLPGLGHATPIVWGDRVYVQTAIKTDKQAESGGRAKDDRPRRPGPNGPHGGGPPPGGPPRIPGMANDAPAVPYRFALLALDRRTGKVVWQKVLREEVPHEAGHPTGSPASASPVTDGTHIIAHFGSHGLYGLDMDGNVLWEQDLGKMQTRRGFGEGSSPALFGDTVVVVCDHEGQSFIAAFDKATGKRKWRVDRDEVTTWATPLILAANGKPQVVANGKNRIRAYDLGSGELIWQCGGLTSNPIPSPLNDNRYVYATSGFRGNALLAIAYANATGDVTDSATVAWSYDGKDTPYVPSPVLYDGSLYFLNSKNAVLACVDAATGKPHYAKKRLQDMEDVYASLVAAKGRVYVAGRDGKTAVVKHGKEFKLLAMNALDESFSASPAIAGDELYLRGRSHLYCIAAE